MLRRNWSLRPQASLRVIGAHGATADPIEFYNAGPHHYFTTAAPAEVAMLDAGVVVKSWSEAVHRLSAVSTYSVEKLDSRVSGDDLGGLKPSPDRFAWL